MGVSIVVGGQFGSEGKGKTARFFADKLGASAVVRVGGTNSGHTVIDAAGNEVVFRSLPTAAIDRRAYCILPPGSYLDVEVFFEEIERSGVDPSKVKVHPNAAVITENHIRREREAGLAERIGSTGSGTGAAVSARVERSPGCLLAKDVEKLRPFVMDTTEFLRKELDAGREVLIEGTQGFGLSNLHSSYYPKATSRDTSAAGFLSETGLSPFDVTNIIMVLRTFPIRVAGESGELPGETDWAEISRIAGGETAILEMTTVTKRVRRVARFDEEVVKRAMASNRPNTVVLNHCDYFDYSIHDRSELSKTAERAVQEIEALIGKVDYIGTGQGILFER